MYKIKFLSWAGKPEIELANLRDANLRDANLRDANLRDANLRDANLRDADLRCANLRDANLRDADLRCANLQGADLRCANLQGADLRSADLRSADLRSADLRSADLQGADLQGADLQGADLRSANLRDADLRCANLRYANLQGADLRYAKNISALTAAQTFIVPEDGAFVGWKKCRDEVLVQVQIPAHVKRSNSTGRKCRAEEVIVLQVIGAIEGVSQYSQNTVYRVGETVKCDLWNPDRWVECGGGIHFFLTRVEAENY